ncbi:DUF4129 domain-containing protein [Haloechinothrix salitolerans]|uniref:DUF4129 domain-containing protein n=1 Tax=Haloechinothrix salitolerans TaxID=926830 RepID=A0ABW2BUC7_9PSEU
MTVALGAVDVPVEPGRDEAREAARDELSNPLYREAEPSWFERLITWLGDRLDELFGAVAEAGPGGVVGLLIVLGVLLIVVVVIRLRTGKLARSPRAAEAPLGDVTVPASAHREDAAAALAAADLRGAVVARFRALARELEQRGVLDVQTGRTADELAAQAADALPACADALRAAARIFDDVYYGGKPATTDGYGVVAETDDAVRTGRPALAGTAS